MEASLALGVWALVFNLGFDGGVIVQYEDRGLF